MQIQLWGWGGGGKQIPGAQWTASLAESMSSVFCKKVWSNWGRHLMISGFCTHVHTNAHALRPEHTHSTWTHTYINTHTEWALNVLKVFSGFLFLNLYCAPFILRVVWAEQEERKGSGEWLSAYEHRLLLQGTRVLFPAPAWWLIKTCNSSSRKSDVLFWLLWALRSWAHTHT